MEQQSLRDKKQFPSVKQVIFCGMQNCSSQMRALAATALTCAQHTSRMCQCVRTILKQGSRKTKREPQRSWKLTIVKDTQIFQEISKQGISEGQEWSQRMGGIWGEILMSRCFQLLDTESYKCVMLQKSPESIHKSPGLLHEQRIAKEHHLWLCNSKAKFVIFHLPQ